MNQNMKKEMEGAYLQACDSYSSNVTDLYIKLERIFDKYFSVGHANERDRFIADTGLGVSLKFVFYKGSTEIYAGNYINNNIEETLVLSKEQSARKEYEVLRGFETALLTQGLAIGRSYPEKFEQVLRKLKPGMIVSFTEGRSYVCKENNDGVLDLDEVFDGDIKNLDIKKFIVRKPVHLNTHYPADVQLFYQKNRKLLTHTMETEYSLLDAAYLRIKSIEKNVTPLRSQKVQIGPISLMARKSFGGRLSWYTSNGKQIEREQVAYFLGVLNTQPMVTTYERQNPTYAKTADDAEFRRKIEGLLDVGEYQEAYKAMLAYSKENENDLTIKTDGFLKRGDDFLCGTITFRNGQAYKTTYENNDFDVIKGVSLLSVEEFSKICEQKYNDTFERVFAITLDEIREKYEAKTTRIRQTQELVARSMAEKRMEKQKGSIFSKEEIKMGESEQKDMLEGLDENNDYEDFLEER